MTPEQFLEGLPALYRANATDMGFLTLTGGEVLVPLDGQHRLKAIEFAISARDQKGKNIPDITPCNDLANEDVTVILVPFEAKKARRIFAKVNRYAKPTTAGQNIVTEDDDMVAVLTREIANDFVGGELTKFRSNTLTTKDREFTTLSTIYNCNMGIITRTFFDRGKLDKTKLPEVAVQNLWRKTVREVWEVIFDGIDVFLDALADTTESGDDKRREIRKTNLLGKPVAQECLVLAYLRLIDLPTGMGPSLACNRLNALPWALNEENVEIWQSVLWTGGSQDGRIITKNRKLSTRLIAYLAGEKLGDGGESDLLRDYRAQFPESVRSELDLPAIP